jgi:hypothetical protein
MTQLSTSTLAIFGEDGNTLLLIQDDASENRK